MLQGRWRWTEVWKKDANYLESRYKHSRLRVCEIVKSQRSRDDSFIHSALRVLLPPESNWFVSRNQKHLSCKEFHSLSCCIYWKLKFNKAAFNQIHWILKEDLGFFSQPGSYFWFSRPSCWVWFCYLAASHMQFSHFLQLLLMVSVLSKSRKMFLMKCGKWNQFTGFDGLKVSEHFMNYSHEKRQEHVMISAPADYLSAWWSVVLQSCLTCDTQMSSQRFSIYPIRFSSFILHCTATLGPAGWSRTYSMWGCLDVTAIRVNNVI